MEDGDGIQKYFYRALQKVEAIIRKMTRKKQKIFERRKRRYTKLLEHSRR
jgi:hypothetical protein